MILFFICTTVIFPQNFKLIGKKKKKRSNTVVYIKSAKHFFFNLLKKTMENHSLMCSLSSFFDFLMINILATKVQLTIC